MNEQRDMMMSKKEIKRLARKSLEEKWYPIDEKAYNINSWTGDCPFCVDAKERTKGEGSICNVCYITNLPICYTIGDWYDRHNKKVVVKALEELAETGELSDETGKEVKI